MRLIWFESCPLDLQAEPIMNSIDCSVNFPRLLRVLALLAYFSLEAQSSQAQTEEPARPVYVEIVKKDNTILNGQLLGVKRDTASFRDEYGNEFRIPMTDIRNIDYRSSSKKRNRWTDSPNILRYLFAPTALQLERGDVIYQNTYLFLNSAQVGISDRMIVGAGVDVGSAGTYYFNTKVNLFNRDKYKFAAGLSYFHLPADLIETTSGEDIRDLGIVSAVATWGNPNHHFSIGAGYLVFRSYFLPPLVSVSGTTRFAKNFALVTENWFFFVGEQLDIPVIISAGLRYIGKRSTIDVGYFGDHKFSGEIGIPYISYSIQLWR
jgi:hypothetical protein